MVVLVSSAESLVLFFIYKSKQIMKMVHWTRLLCPDLLSFAIANCWEKVDETVDVPHKMRDFYGKVEMLLVLHVVSSAHAPC